MRFFAITFSSAALGAVAPWIWAWIGAENSPHGPEGSAGGYIYMVAIVLTIPGAIGGALAGVIAASLVEMIARRRKKSSDNQT